MTMPTFRASLLLLPKSSTMSSLAPGGWFSMTKSPMAMTSDGAPATSPAISSPMAMPSAAARPPATKAATSAERERAAPDAGATGRGVVVMARVSKQASVTIRRRALRHTRSMAYQTAEQLQAGMASVHRRAQGRRRRAPGRAAARAGPARDPRPRPSSTPSVASSVTTGSTARDDTARRPAPTRR